MEINSQEIFGGTILIDNTSDKITECKLKKVKLVARVPLLLINNQILWTKPAQCESVDREKPYARISGCVLDDVELPMGEYDGNYFKETVSAKNVTIK